MRNFCLLVCTALLSWPLVTVSQSIAIRGVVFNESDGRVAGASIIVKNTKTGCTTGSHGQFTITIPMLPATLICKAVGYKDAEYIVTPKDTAVPTNPISIVLHSSGGTMVLSKVFQAFAAS